MPHNSPVSESINLSLSGATHNDHHNGDYQNSHLPEPSPYHPTPLTLSHNATAAKSLIGTSRQWSCSATFALNKGCVMGPTVLPLSSDSRSSRRRIPHTTCHRCLSPYQHRPHQQNPQSHHKPKRCPVSLRILLCCHCR